VFFTLADPATSRAYALRILTGERIEWDENRVSSLVQAANGQLRDIATLIQLWTTGNKLVYEGVGNVKPRIVELFKLLNAQDLNKSLGLVDELMRETSDREIVRELALRIRDSKMPDSVKEKAIVTMLETDAALVQGVDTHTALWSMIVKLMIAVRQAKPQAQVKKQ
jgi:DNA polymerase III gamma/tau subunit